MDKVFFDLFNNEFFPVIEILVGSLLIFLIGVFVLSRVKDLVERERLRRIWLSLVKWLIVLGIVAFIFAKLESYGWMNKKIFLISNIFITPMKIFQLIFTIFVGHKLSKILRDYLLGSVYARYDLDSGTKMGLDSLIRYAIILIIGLFSMNILGINLRTFNVFASVLGVGIGFGLRNIMNNMVSGLIILFDKSMVVGDRVIIDGLVTTIERIKIRHTVVRTRLEERVIVPNSYFLENKFINRSYDDRRLRVAVGVSVVYGSDLDKAEDLIMDSLGLLGQGELGEFLSSPNPRVFVEDLGDYAISLKVYFWIDRQEDELEFRIPSDLRKIIYRKFNENSIDFAFPRQDVKLI